MSSSASPTGLLDDEGYLEPEPTSASNGKFTSPKRKRSDKSVAERRKNISKGPHLVAPRSFSAGPISFSEGIKTQAMATRGLPQQPLLELCVASGVGAGGGGNVPSSRGRNGYLSSASSASGF